MLGEVVPVKDLCLGAALPGRKLGSQSSREESALPGRSLPGGTSRQALELASDITLVLWFWFLSVLLVHKYAQALPADSVDTENKARGQVRLMPALQHLSCAGGRGKEGSRGTATRGGINNVMTAVSARSARP